MKSTLIIACVLYLCGCQTIPNQSERVAEGIAPQVTTKPELPIICYTVGPFNPVLFPQGKISVDSDAAAELDKLIAELKKYPNDTVVAQGHTDDIGTDAENMAIGQRRANAVRAYMVGKGINSARIQSVSLGETAPVVPNDREANRKLNRRVAFDYRIGSG